MAANPYITPDFIRLFLLDRASDNFLLDEEQFKDESLDAAIILTVDRWNETSPFVSPFTPENFPFRHSLIMGVTATLLRMKGLNMIRNKVDYQTAGGVTVDEKSSARDYFAVAKDFMAEFDAKIKHMKMQINIGEGYGQLGSPYAIINQSDW